MKKYYNILILIAAFSGFLAVQLTFDLVDLSAEPTSVESLEFTHINRAFRETNFRTKNGVTYNINNIRTPITIINFWASWCAPCLMELPWFQKIHEEFNLENVTLLSVNVDEEGNRAKMRRVIKKYGLTFPIIEDSDGKISSSFLVESLPMTLILKNGQTVEMISDASQISESSLKEKISALID